MRATRFIFLSGCLGILAVQTEAAPFHLRVNDAAGKPLPCRIHLYNAAGKPLFTKGLPAWRDHFVCDGNAKIELPAGQYRYEIERGPEYETSAGVVELKAGRSFVTNGPLLRVRALEVIHNGAVIRKIPCADQLHQKLQATVKLKTGGWFLLRAITDKKTTFRFASTAPFYVEVGKASRISHRSAQFFLDWVKQRQARVPNKLKNPTQLREANAD